MSGLNVVGWGWVGLGGVGVWFAGIGPGGGDEVWAGGWVGSPWDFGKILVGYSWR